MSLVRVLLCAAALVAGAPTRALAIEYTLQTASLLHDAFYYYVRGSVGRAEGELAVPALERVLDTGEIGSGALLYDRDVAPAGATLARGFGAVPVGVTGQTGSEGPGYWQSVRWEGNPGERALWVVRPRSPHHQRVRYLALSGVDGGLRYFLPYTVSLWPRPLRAVVYQLDFLRSAEDGALLWDRYLRSSVDLGGDLAAIVGQASSWADWVYLVVSHPAQPVTFKVVVGWGRGPLDEQRVGVRGNEIRRR